MITGNAVSGNVLKQQLAYDPWGKQSTLWSHSQFVLGKYLGEMRGYTGHTMVNDMDVIHMGGRTYNPVLGRFMQADPFIQAGTNLQNYNRYSYVLNNPLSYTDPSGYFFKKLSTTFGRFTPLVAIAIMVIPGAQPLGVTMLQGFFAGGIATGNLRGAIVGGLTAGMGKSLGGLKGVGGFMSRGIVGGAASSVQGGKFSHGFVSAGASSIGGNAGSPTGNILMSAIVGGTVSHLVGGKFANGATSGAFAQILSEGGNQSQYRRSSRSVPLTAEQREAFEPQFRILRDKVARSSRFDTSEDAANWLHENVHSKLTVDVEVGAYIYQTGEQFFIGALQTDYMTNSLNLVMVGRAQPYASWHSHGTHKGLYWRPSLDDIRLDRRQNMTYGYTSTTHHGGSLWRFDVNEFKASNLPLSYDNTQLYMCNLRREGNC
ncbi:RHS repeat-associated core domain-containing protein [Aliidiomarina quisquiliarum]|uniref:RHS repeat-associated core domain-containing protein n=1 Tax=Aliidiomarina quisquiliarum TaxID=2938947 RepID=UPI00208EA78C|nr:hypothetical protein [Aliidiomarina quisquiliarum]